MAYKIDPVKIIRFSFHPVGGGEQSGSSINIGLIDIGIYLEANANIILQVMKMVYYCQFFAGLIRIMNRAEICQEPEPQLFIIIKKIEHFKVEVFGRFKGEHSVRFCKCTNLLTEFFS